MDLLALDNAQPKLVGGSTSRRITGTVYATSLDASTSIASLALTQNSQAVLDASTAFGGDLSGVHGTATVVKLQGRSVHNAAPSDGNVLTWDNVNSRWAPAAPSGGGIPDPGTRVTNDLLQYTGAAWDARGAASGDRVAGTLYLTRLDADTSFDCGDTRFYAGNLHLGEAGEFHIGTNIKPATAGVSGSTISLTAQAGSDYDNGMGPGVGGEVTLTGGQGGLGDMVSVPSGDGGDVFIKGGLPGTDIGGGIGQLGRVRIGEDATREVIFGAPLLAASDGSVNIGASGNYRPDYIYARTEVKVGNSCSIKSDRISLNAGAGDPGSLVAGDVWYNASTGKIKYRHGSTNYDVADTVSAMLNPGTKATNDLLQYNGTAWDAVGASGDPVLGTIYVQTALYVNSKLVMKADDSAGGDLSGTYPNPTVARLQGRAVSSGAPTTGDIFQWNGSSWDAVGGDSTDPILGVLYTEGIALKGPAKNIVWMTDGGGNIGGASDLRPEYIYAKTGIYQGANQVLDTSLGGTKNSGDLLQWNGSSWDARGSSGDRIQSTLYGSAVDLAGHLTFTADNTYDIGASGATRPRTIYAATSIYQGSHQVVDKDTAGAIALNSAQGVTLSTATSASLGAYIWQANELLLSSTLHWTFAFSSNSNSQTYRIYVDYWNGTAWALHRDVGAINNSTGTIFFYDVYITTDPRDNARVLCWGRGSTGQITYLDDKELSANFFTTANRGLRITARRVSDSYTGYASGIMREMRGG